MTPRVTTTIRRWSFAVAAFVIASVVGIGTALVPTAPAAAADATQFQPGFIISNEMFYNSSLMGEAEVQRFLESRVAVCKATTGPACLKDYRLSSPAKVDASNFCAVYQGGTNELASRVLVNVAKACNINPQVLIVLLEKEQGLVSSTAPSERMYRSATGYGCPDTADCDAAYYGLFNQLYNAARQFNRYVAPGSTFRYKARQNNVIQWHPNAACGSSTVYIENEATAALYNYTPYRPNQAALSNLYGIGDSCSSYGNRNFWRIFSDWFGSPIVSAPLQSFVKAVYQDVLNREPSIGDVIGWGKALMAGMPRSQLAGGFVNSDEFRLLNIDFAYREVLGREPEAGGRLSWLNGMRSGALTPDDAYRIFMQTDEYYSRTGGTNPLWVAAVYERIIKRPAAETEVAYWTGMTEKYGRATVVNLIWFSVETSRARVATMYQNYLGRTPDYDGLVQWGDLALRYGDGWVRSAIIGSDEYFARAQSRYPI